jgi:L-threonylcarbamoyladenylate synthase
MPLHVIVDPAHPDPAVMQEAVAILCRGGIVAYPTDTVYGLAVDAMNPEAIARLYIAKGRPLVKALPVVIGSLAQLPQIVATYSPLAAQLMSAFWPGPLTLLLAPHHAVPKQLLGESHSIGVRWPASAVSQQLALGLGRAITASSANRSGVPAALTAAEVMEQLGSAVELILDAGEVTSAVVSTIVDMTVEPPVLSRAGKIPLQTLESVLQCKIISESVETILRMPQEKKI